MTGDARRRALRTLLDLRGQRPDVLDLLRRHRAPPLRALGLQAGVVAIASLGLDAAWAAGFARCAVGGLFGALVQMHRAAASWPLQEAVTEWPAVIRLARESGLSTPGMVE